MARTKTFDPDVVLDKAMEVFWKQGYYATSMGDLVDELGVNRASLYGTFGDKRELFITAFRRYLAGRMELATKFLEEDTTPLNKIRHLFYSMIDHDKDCHGKGCFMRNTIVEFCNEDKEINQITDEVSGRFRDNMTKLLREGQKIGEVTEEVPATKLASYIETAISGLSVTAITNNNDAKELKGLVNTMLTTISA